MTLRSWCALCAQQFADASIALHNFNYAHYTAVLSQNLSGNEYGLAKQNFCRLTNE